MQRLLSGESNSLLLSSLLYSSLPIVLQADQSASRGSSVFRGIGHRLWDAVHSGVQRHVTASRASVTNTERSPGGLGRCIMSLDNDELSYGIWTTRLRALTFRGWKKNTDHAQILLLSKAKTMTGQTRYFIFIWIV
jgi:hypothetical protein